MLISILCRCFAKKTDPLDNISTELKNRVNIQWRIIEDEGRFRGKLLGAVNKFTFPVKWKPCKNPLKGGHWNQSPNIDCIKPKKPNCFVYKK